MGLTSVCEGSHVRTALAEYLRSGTISPSEPGDDPSLAPKWVGARRKTRRLYVALSHTGKRDIKDTIFDPEQHDAVVYAILVRQPFMIYVGATIHAMHRRLANHIDVLKGNRRLLWPAPGRYEGNTPMRLAWGASGPQAFCCEILEWTETYGHLHLAREKAWITALKARNVPLANLPPGFPANTRPVSASHTH